MNIVYYKDNRVISWNVDASGSWFTASNWLPSTFPGGAGSSVNCSFALTSARTVVLDQVATVTNLTIGSTGANLTIGGLNTLYFESLSGNCTLSVSGIGRTHVLNAPITLRKSIVIDVSATTILTLSSSISGLFGWEKTGAGTLQIASGTKTYTGNVIVTTGIVSFTSDADFGNSSNSISLAAQMSYIGSGITTTNRNIAITANSIIVSSSGSLIMSGIISGTGNITFAGSGIKRLNNTSNTFNGRVIISAGELQVGSDLHFGNSANIIQLTDTLKILSSFTTARTIQMMANGAVIEVNSGQTFTLSSVISGTFNWAKNGAGILKYTANHNVGGLLTISAPDVARQNGITVITGTWGASAGNISIQNLAHLEGTGSVKGITFAANADSYIGPGENGVAGVLTCTGLTMNSATNVENKIRIFTSGTTVGRIQVNSNLVLNGQLDLPSSSLDAGTYDIINYTGTLTNTAFTLNTNNTGKAITITVDTINKKVQITAI